MSRACPEYNGHHIIPTFVTHLSKQNILQEVVKNLIFSPLENFSKLNYNASFLGPNFILGSIFSLKFHEWRK